MSMVFHDRRDAGQQLAEHLGTWRDQAGVIVLGIPRGGVIIAVEVARALRAPLDVFITRKLGAPDNPELAFGAVASDGATFLNEAMIEELGIPRSFVEHERENQLREIERRLSLYRGDRPALEIAGRTVILCDDGIATGATTLAALRAIRQRKPARLILAVPVAPGAVVRPISQECDECVFLATPEPFWSVGRFYLHFDQISDEQVIAALGELP